VRSGRRLDRRRLTPKFSRMRRRRNSAHAPEHGAACRLQRHVRRSGAPTTGYARSSPQDGFARRRLAAAARVRCCTSGSRPVGCCGSTGGAFSRLSAVARCPMPRCVGDRSSAEDGRRLSAVAQCSGGSVFSCRFAHASFAPVVNARAPSSTSAAPIWRTSTSVVHGACRLRQRSRSRWCAGSGEANERLLRCRVRPECSEEQRSCSKSLLRQAGRGAGARLRAGVWPTQPNAKVQPHAAPTQSCRRAAAWRRMSAATLR
jgi:hypothetical protein